MLNTTTFIDNYQLLDLLGLIEPAGEFVKLSNKALVLRDSMPFEDICYSSFPLGTMVFPLTKILKGGTGVFTQEDLKGALQNHPYLRYLRVFFAKFRPDPDGRITQKADSWDSIKAWRYDIDVVKDDDLKKDRESAIQKIIDKERDILELIEKLPLKPNIIKRSNKGWHLIYVFDEFITRDAYETYLKRYNNPKENKPEDSITDQFIVYELLTKHVPNYLAELEPQLDVQASNKISSIATRFVIEDLPAYITHPPYPFKEFRKAFEYLMRSHTDKGEKEEKVGVEVAYKQGKIPYTIYDISKETFLSLMDRCNVLKALDEDWENHGESEWYVMTNYYAIRILYADTPEEAEDLRQEFHEKSSRWKGNGNKRYTYNEAERQLQYYIKKQEEGLKPPTCKYIYHNLSSKYTTICHTCPYRKFDPQGNMIANFIFDGLKNDSLEDIMIPGWELREDGWYMEIRSDNDKSKDSPESIWIRVFPYFKIRTYYLVGGANFTELIDVVDEKGISTIHILERRKDTLQVNPDLVIPYGEINPDWVTPAKRFLTHYIEKVKKHRGVKIKFLGIRYINGVWDIAAGGYGNYRRNNLAFIFYGEETSKKWFVPSVQGSLETFKDIYYHAFLLDDPPLHVAIAHFLSWIGEQFIDNKSFELEINPILIFVGDNETGKSIRAKIAVGLYGNPAIFSFSNISQASFNNRFPLIKCPFVIDEVMTKNSRSEEKLGELLYNIGNKSGKMTAYATYNPIEVPIILIGETENLLIDKLFSTYRGLVRRSLVINITKEEYKNNSDTLDYLLEELRSNYGHIITYVKGLTENDREVIEEEAKKIYEWGLKFATNGLKELKKHLALSLSMFKHFYKYFIGFSESEIDNKIKKVIKLIADEIGENQLNKIGDTVDYVEEVIQFISSVLKAEKRGESLKGMNYKGVKEKIEYKPSDNVGKLLKKFFWKKYISNGTKTNLRFTPGVLIINPIEFGLDNEEEPIIKKDIIQADRERLNELTDEELRIWADVLRLRYDDETMQKIVDALGNERLRKIIYSEKAEIMY
jgi:hypothetical protein